MKIGVPRETKDGERRVGLTPENVRALVEHGHEVRCESGLGQGIGAADEEYARAGGKVVSVAEAWDAELIVKVKELQPGESARLKVGSTLFGYLQLVGAPNATREIAARGVNAIAYERVRGADGRYPLLAPMSAIAGRMAVSVGAWLLGLPQGGNGTLLGGAPGAGAGNVLILGAGNAGRNAADVASAMGANVTLLGRDATPAAIEAAALAADLVIGAAHVAGQPTPKILTRALLARMRRGAVLVDVSIDGGGVSETSRPTSHSSPTYVDEGVVHYCVANMPGAFPRTSTRALSSAVLPYVMEMADRGVAAAAVRVNAALRAGILVWEGTPTDARLAAESGLACRDAEGCSPSPLGEGRGEGGDTVSTSMGEGRGEGHMR